MGSLHSRTDATAGWSLAADLREAPRSSTASTADGPGLPSAGSRVVIENVQPSLENGRFAVKRCVGDLAEFSADIFADGHDVVMARLLYRAPGQAEWTSLPLNPVGNDRWEARLPLVQNGRYEFVVEAWVDAFLTWRHGLEKKHAAGVNVATELLEGAALVQKAAQRASAADAGRLTALARFLASGASAHDLVPLSLGEELAELMARHPDRGAAERSAVHAIWVDRERAVCGAWYEFFPRSCAKEPGRHGTLANATARLPYVAEMGFDVVYLPPIHPIGRQFRKGPNNSPQCRPGDHGSPWAIGGPEGGHDAIHPDLGTLADFDGLVRRARELGLEVALDLALQCAPDHPYVREHPDWFRRRPDGTIQYAENPPKKYQDIYPLDFDCQDWRGLWAELKRVVLSWVARGVEIFRVDNPHTKPFRFWEWLIGEVQAEHPRVLFLAEAFTRPKIMRRLAKLGFTQSYTYFTWRNTQAELVEYLTELTQTEVREYFRPNFFANTPDILHAYLQQGGRAAFQTRAILAATLGATYGVYGPPFELCEGRGLPGSEEYVDSEKYEPRVWDLDAPHSLRPLLTRLNRIRRAHPALQRNSGLHFHRIDDNDQLLCYSKRSSDGQDCVLAIVNLDPHHVQQGMTELDLEALGLPSDARYAVHDLLRDERYAWQGPRNFVQLDPGDCPGHVFALTRFEEGAGL